MGACGLGAGLVENHRRGVVDLVAGSPDGRRLANGMRVVDRDGGIPTVRGSRSGRGDSHRCVVRARDGGTPTARGGRNERRPPGELRRGLRPRFDDRPFLPPVEGVWCPHEERERIARDRQPSPRKRAPTFHEHGFPDGDDVVVRFESVIACIESRATSVVAQRPFAVVTVTRNQERL